MSYVDFPPTSSSLSSIQTIFKPPYDKIKVVALVAMAVFAISFGCIFLGAISRHYQWLKMAGAVCFGLDIALWVTMIAMPVCCPKTHSYS